MSEIIKLVGTIKITNKLKKTKAVIFKDAEVNDILILSCKLGTLGISRGRSYAPYTYVENTRTNNGRHFSFNEFGRYISNFEFEQVEN